jgi:hypothetical protein
VALPEQNATRRDCWGPGFTALGERTLANKNDVDALSLAFPSQPDLLQSRMIFDQTSARPF